MHGRGAHLAERAVRRDIPVEIDLDHLARIDLADEGGADHVERDRFAGEYRRVAKTAHHQRADAERIAAGDHALRGHQDQRIGAFDQPQCVDDLVEQLGITAGCDKVDDHLGVAGRLEDRAAANQVAAQVPGVGDVAVMSHRETAARQLGVERLDVAQAGAAGGRIAHVPGGHRARQFGDRFSARKIGGHMAQAAAREELGPVEAGYADGFLPAMLQRMEAERADGRGLVRAEHAENSTLFAQLVAVRVNERMSDVHESLEGSPAARPQWRLGRRITSMLRSKPVGEARWFTALV